MNNIQKLKQIIGNAPKIFTHLTSSGRYARNVNGNWQVSTETTPSKRKTIKGDIPEMRSLEDIRTIVEQAERIAELEKKLKPRLYWDASNTEISHDSIEELMHLKFEDGFKVGDEVEIQRAVLLPSETYVFTKIDDEDYSYEYELKEHKGDE